MKISTNTLHNQKQLSFSMADKWLTRIAQDLNPVSPDSSDITGELKFKSDNAGFIHVSGNVSAKATLPCDRCGRDVNFDLNTSVIATFRPPYQESAPREMALTEEDFEVYFIEDGHLDLEAVVNDSLQCSIPSHILCDENDSEGCGGEANQSDNLVYGESAPNEDESPFSVLKNLKKS